MITLVGFFIRGAEDSIAMRPINLSLEASKIVARNKI